VHLHQPRKTDLGLWAIVLLFGVPCLLGLLYCLALIINVIYFGGGSACPQNLC
jgi:hypothetical protein